MVIMERGRHQMDTADKVRLLQDTIRKLELQNEQLRAQQFAKNGLIGTQVCDSIKGTDADLEIIPLNEKDLSDEQTWLYVPEKASASDTRIDIEEWLRRKVEGNNNIVKDSNNMLTQRLLNLDHGEKQSIDSRTFTRPKKRLGILSTVTPSNMSDNFKHKEEKRVSGHDELSAMLQSAGLPLKGVLDSILQKHRKSPVVGVDSVIPTEGSPINDGASNNKLNSTYVFQEGDEQDIVLSPRKALNVRGIPTMRRSGGLGSTGVKGSCPALDQTFEVATPTKQALPLVRGRRETGSTPVLDSTFSLAKGNSPHSEEDCLSTTSDGSLSSSSRPMNVDDVQQMARLQEESLKQSTPVRGQKPIMVQNVEEMPSPILHGNATDDNHGYHSDRSSPIGSLTDGGRGHRTCSQGSSLAGGDSLHSSPMNSPHGSSQALHQLPTRNGLQYKDAQGHALKVNSRSHSRDNIYHNHDEESVLLKTKEMKPVSEATSGILNANSDSCTRSMGTVPQLRPQVDQGGSMLRSGPGRGAGGIRPPSVVTSGIPRPQSRFQSRIPAPMQRIPASRVVQKKPTKADWMDGCY